MLLGEPGREALWDAFPCKQQQQIQPRPDWAARTHVISCEEELQVGERPPGLLCPISLLHLPPGTASPHRRGEMPSPPDVSAGPAVASTQANRCPRSTQKRREGQGSWQNLRSGPQPRAWRTRQQGPRPARLVAGGQSQAQGLSEDWHPASPKSCQ